MDTLTLLDVAGVARRLNRSRAWLYANRRRLETAGFPVPLPIVGRWDPAAVDAWIAAQGRTDAAIRRGAAKERLDAAFGVKAA